MNIYDFSNYVNQDVDDTFTVEEIARWFNKAVANFNLIPPVTKFPYITMDVVENIGVTSSDQFSGAGSYNTDSFYYGNADPSKTNAQNLADDEIGAYNDYPLSRTFMIGVMLPYVVSAVKGQESSITEKQLILQEFLINARQFKSSLNIKTGYLVDGENNPELSQYRLGENVYLTDFTQAPFAGEWNKATVYKEYVVTRKNDRTVVKYVDNSLVDENVETMEEEDKY
jgi:hypothetical protein